MPIAFATWGPASLPLSSSHAFPISSLAVARNPPPVPPSHRWDKVLDEQIASEIQFTCTHACKHTLAHIRTQAHTNTHAHTYTHMHTQIHTHMHTQTHTHTHAHTCTHKHTHTCTHAHARKLKRGLGTPVNPAAGVVRPPDGALGLAPCNDFAAQLNRRHVVTFLYSARGAIQPASANRRQSAMHGAPCKCLPGGRACLHFARRDWAWSSSSAMLESIVTAACSCVLKPKECEEREKERRSRGK